MYPEMNVAYFIGTLKDGDGVCRVLVKLIEGANKHDINNLIVTSHSEHEELYPTKIIYLPTRQFPLYKEYYFPSLSHKLLEEKLGDFKPDIVHVHSPDTSAWLALHLAKKLNIPIIITHHTDFITYLPYYHLGFLTPLLWMYFRWLYNKVTVVTTPSPVIEEQLKNNGIKRVISLPNGIDLSRFNPKRRSLAWRNKITKNKDVPILFFVARLTWEKDLETLIEIGKLLEARKKNKYKLVIAGDGPARKEMEERLPQAIYLGNISRPDIATAYASSDIFLFPSTTETFGLVTIEAMASGTVSVVANAGGSKFVVQHNKNGLIAEPKNAEDFYKKVDMLLTDTKLKKRLEKTGLESAKRFGWEIIYKEMFDLYKKLIARGGFRQ